MSEKQDLQLGKVITDPNAQRDAIHIAVLPVVALNETGRGEHVGLSKSGKVSERIKPHIGVIDPFLSCYSVNAGQRVWLFLYPNTITGLRHHWEHPIIDAENEVVDKSRTEVIAWSMAAIETEANKMGMSGEEMLQHASEWVSGEEYVLLNYDTPEGVKKVDWNKFWQHYEVITGRKLKTSKDHGKEIQFSCSC